MAFDPETWMRVAEVIARESKAQRSQVGAVLVKGDRIISTGINGMPPGFPNECEDEHGNTKQEVIHAESNAVAWAARNNGGTDGSALYTTLSPCAVCAGLILSAGVSSVYYRTSYRDSTGLDTLRARGISVTHLSEKNS